MEILFNLNILFSNLSLKNNYIFNKIQENNTEYTAIYTNGSRNSEGTAASFDILDINKTKQFVLPKEASTFLQQKHLWYTNILNLL